MSSKTSQLKILNNLVNITPINVQVLKSMSKPTEHVIIPTSQDNSNKRINSSKLKIVHLNARSLKNRTNLGQISELSRDIKPDALHGNIRIVAQLIGHQ